MDCECVSCVLVASLSSLCAFRQLISKQRLTSRAAVGKQTASSQVVSEQGWKVPKESTLQVVTGVGTTCVDEQNFEERTRKPTTSKSERQFAGSKLAVRKIQFLKLSKTENYLVTLGLVERAQVQYSKTKAALQDQDCSIVGGVRVSKNCKF